MAKRGPKPKAETTREPGPLPPRPDWCNGEIARQLWDDFAPVLNRLGLLESLDKIGFGIFCLEFESYLKAAEQLSPDELIQYVGENGHPAQNPLVSIIRQQQKSVREWLTEFGLTPGSRTALTGSTSVERLKEELSPLQQLQQRMNGSGPTEAQQPAPKKKPTKRATKRRPAKKKAAKKKTSRKR